MLRALLKDTVLYSSSQILPRIFAFLLLPVISQYLEPSDYGMLGQVAILSLVATSIVNLGLNISINKVYFETSDRTVQSSLIWTSFFVLLAFNACLFSAVTYFAPHISHFLLGEKMASPLVIIMFASVSVSGLIVPFTTYLKLEQKAFLIVSLAIFEVLTASLLTVYFVIAKGFGVTGPLLSQLIAQGVLFFLFFMIILSRVPFKISFGKEFRAALILGLPYMFSFFGSFLIQSGARFSLVKVRGLEEAGIFFVAQNCAKVLELFMMGMTAAWVPLIAQIAHDKQKRMAAVKKVTSTFTTVIAIPVAAAFLFAKPVLSLLVPEALATGWNVVGLLALAQGIFGFYVLLQPLFIFEKKGVFQVLVEAMAGLMGTIVAFFACSSFGLVGAASGQLTACLFLVFATLLILRNLELDKGPLLKAFLTLLAVIPVSFLQPESTVLQFLMGMSVLGLLLAINFRPVKRALAI